MNKHIVFLMSALLSVPAVSEAGLLDNVVTVVNKVSEVAGATQSNGTSSDKKTSRRTNTNTTSTNTGTGIQNIVTAKDVSNNKPQGLSNRFPNDTVRIYLCFNYSSLNSGDVIKVIWYSSNNGNLTKIYESQMTVSTASGFGEFHIKLPQNTKWPIGAYRVDVMLNIGLAGSVNFDIYDPSSSTTTSSSSSPSSSSSTSSSSSQSGNSLLDQILGIAGGGTSATTSTKQNAPAQATQTKQSSSQLNGSQQQNWPGQIGNDTQQQNVQQQNPGVQAVAPVASGTQVSYGNPDGGTCQEAGYEYSIKYLNGWKYIKQSKNTIKFINFDEDANVIIQNILSASNGGKYSNQADIMTDIKNQLAGMPNYNIISEGEHIVNNITASQFAVSYMNGSAMWQEWYICIPKPDGKLFYLFCYRSTQKVYSKYLSTARIMLASFTPLGTAEAVGGTPKAQGGTTAPQQKKSPGEDFSF